MPKTRLIAVNNNAGAYTVVPSTIPCHTVEIVEDGSVTAQGLEIQFPGDSYGTTDTYTPGQTVILTGHGQQGVLGYPEQGVNGQPSYRAADNYCQVRSATATATTIRVVEQD